MDLFESTLNPALPWDLHDKDQWTHVGTTRKGQQPLPASKGFPQRLQRCTEAHQEPHPLRSRSGGQTMIPLTPTDRTLSMGHKGHSSQGRSVTSLIDRDAEK